MTRFTAHSFRQACIRYMVIAGLVGWIPSFLVFDVSSRVSYNVGLAFLLVPFVLIALLVRNTQLGDNEDRVFAIFMLVLSSVTTFLFITAFFDLSHTLQNPYVRDNRWDYNEYQHRFFFVSAALGFCAGLALLSANALLTKLPEKSKKGLEDKSPYRYGFIRASFAYIVLSGFLGTIASSFLTASLSKLDANFGAFILHAILAVSPFTAIALLVLKGQRPLKGPVREALAALAVLVAVIGVFVIGIALYNTISFIASIPPEARRVAREYDDSYIGMVSLWVVNIGLGFFFGLGVLGGGAFLKQEPNKGKNDTL